MTRKLRILLPGGLYHVILRGNAGLTVFHFDEERYRFEAAGDILKAPAKPAKGRW